MKSNLSHTRIAPWTRWVGAGILAAAQAAAPELLADDTTESINSLKQQIEQLDQKLRVLERNRELEKEAAEAQAKNSGPVIKLPEWVTSVRFVDDLRLRYDGIYAPDSDFVSRNRFRSRLRLGAIATLQDDFEIGFRVASSPSVGKDSGGDPLSTNQTFEDNASRKPVGIDWAFARWTPIHTPDWTGTFTIGKMENPPNYTEDVFDVDYTPEGLAEQFSYKAGAHHTISTYLGQYVLDELQFSNRDPYLFLEQLRLDSKWGERLVTSFGVSGLSIANPRTLTTTSVPDSNHGNTRTPLLTNTNNITTGGALVNDYQLFIADGTATWNLESFPLYKGTFPISITGEYIHNYGASSRNIGYSFGPSFGRVSQRNAAGIKSQKGKWEISYRYQSLEGDANYEELTASDNGAFYRDRPPGEPGNYSFRPTFLNGLNLRGHAFRIAYAPLDSIVIDARVWLNRAIDVSVPGGNPQGIRVLVDLVWKF